MSALDDSLLKRPVLFRFPGTAVLPSLAVLLAASLAWWGGDGVLPIYVWPDVMAVYLFSAFPLAAALTSWFARDDRQGGAIVFGGAGLTLATALLVLPATETGTRRAAAAFGLVVGILWWVSALRKSMARSPQHAPRCSPVPLLVI